MRVLVSAVPAVGHVVPLLDLARALHSAGHEVRFATHADCHRLVADAGLKPVSAGMSAAAMNVERRRRWPETDAQPVTAWAGRMWTQVMAPSTLAGLLDVLAEWPADVLIHDEGDFAGPVAATHAGIPWVTHAWGSPLRPTGELVRLEDLVADLWASCGLNVAPAAGLYTHALVNPCPPILQDQPREVSVAWPIRPRMLESRGPRLQADAYVGFGTVPTFADAPVELEAAVTACISRGMRVVVTAPSEELRRRLARIDPQLVHASEFVSLAHLLPTCKVVISHAGAGTVLASLAAGVPVVLVPRGAPSQLRMSEACQRAGVGRSCDSAGVASAVDQVLGEPSYSAAAAASSRQIAAMPDASAVVPLVEQLAGT